MSGVSRSPVALDRAVVQVLPMSSEIPELPDYSPASLDSFFSAILARFDQEAAAADSVEAVEQLRIRWIGRKQGLLTRVGEVLKDAPAEARREVGKRFNALKSAIEPRCDPAQIPARRAGAEASEAIDITLPGTRRALGAEHPLIRTMNEIVTVFATMGYSVGLGPEVETDYYNFESLNFPPGHPARDTQDTLVIAHQERKPLRERLLMRTHTSPVQIHTMEQQPPPLRIVIPGKVHRNDAADATHSPIFHQVEGLCVDTNITFSDLKGTLDHAMKAFFGASVKTRFFPSFFPFTEPSADVQISCIFCGGRGCRKCKHSGWIELLGCGMVDPAVFAFVVRQQPGYDPKKISGFAFGMGVERIAMMKYGIGDISQLYSGDMRFLEQFR
jgi:phenylalanyl-tRNA synthetase alpha chain